MNTSRVWSTLDGLVLLSTQSQEGDWTHLEMTFDEAKALGERLIEESCRAQRAAEESRLIHD